MFDAEAIPSGVDSVALDDLGIFGFEARVWDDPGRADLRGADFEARFADEEDSADEEGTAASRPAAALAPEFTEVGVVEGPARLEF